MDDIRGSLSKMKKKFKYRLTGRNRNPDGTGTHPDGEGVDSTSSFPQSEPRVVAEEGHGREGDSANAAGERVFSSNQPQSNEPESTPARGGDNVQEGGEADVDGEEASQRHSHQHPDVEVVVGSGRSGELEGVYPSPPTPSISRGGKPDST